jgi:uncharacterized protein (DUF433 family)
VAKGGHITPTRPDMRFEAPLYTVTEAARFLGVPPTTFANWARGYRVVPRGRKPVVGEPIVTAVPAARNYPAVPFVGLAEGLVVAAFRDAGVSLQHIRKAVNVLEREIGIEHALASELLFTDGASILYDYAQSGDEEELLTHVVTQQRVFADVVRDYLRRITYGPDAWPLRIVSPVTSREIVAADPERSFGQPIFIRGGVRVEDVLDRIRADERPPDVAADMGVPLEDVEAVLSAELRRAA